MSGWRKKQIADAMENAMKIEENWFQRMSMGIVAWMMGMVGLGLIARFLYECFRLGWSLVDLFL